MVGKKKKLKAIKNLVQVSEFSGEKAPATTSVKISEVFGKRHDHVLRDIENLIKTGEFDLLNFGEISYKDSYGRDQKMYLLDELFTTVLLMGFTGTESVKWKIAYTKEFQRMRKQIYKASRIIRTAFDDPAELNKAVNDVLVHVREAMGKETKPHHFMAMAENVNEFAFGERGKGKQLRQNMNLKQYQTLNRVLSGSVKGLLKGAIHKNELKEQLLSQGLISNNQILQIS